VHFPAWVGINGNLDGSLSPQDEKPLTPPHRNDMLYLNKTSYSKCFILSIVMCSTVAWNVMLFVYWCIRLQKLDYRLLWPNNRAIFGMNLGQVYDEDRSRY